MSFIEVLGERGVEDVFPCIRDLVENGLSVRRFSVGDSRPDRQDVTQYLAAWCRHVGLLEDSCRDWLTAYCVAMLSSISKSSASRIRHSTKSNIKYIYKAGIAFSCEHESNRFKAHCDSSCAGCATMTPSIITARSREFEAVQAGGPTKPMLFSGMQVKERFRDQFQAALELIRQEIAKGSSRKVILDLLSQHGLKTKTGRPWTPAIMNAEINKIKRSHVPEP